MKIKAHDSYNYPLEARGLFLYQIKLTPNYHENN